MKLVRLMSGSPWRMLAGFIIMLPILLLAFALMIPCLPFLLLFKDNDE